LLVDRVDHGEEAIVGTDSRFVIGMRLGCGTHEFLGHMDERVNMHSHSPQYACGDALTPKLP